MTRTEGVLIVVMLVAGGVPFLLWHRHRDLLFQLIQGVHNMSVQLDALTAEVARVKDVDDSVKALLIGLAAQLQAAKDDPAKIQQLANDLKAQNDAIAEAVLNTPSA